MEEELDALIAAAIQKQLPDAPTAAENPEVVLPDVPEAAPAGIVSLYDDVNKIDRAILARLRLVVIVLYGRMSMGRYCF